MRRLLVLLLSVALLGGVVASGHGGNFGVFEEVVASSDNFADTTAALEKGIAASSDFELLGQWDLTPPQEGSDYHARVYVLDNPAYTKAIGQYEGPHAPAAVLRINVYETGNQKAVQVNIINPDTLARVYLYQHGIADDAFHTLLSMAADLHQKLETLISGSVAGNVLKKPSGPIRAEGDLLGYVGDGNAKVMTNFSDYAADYELGLVKSFASFDAATKWAEDHLNSNSEGWKLIAKLDVGQARYYGITKPDVESVSAKIVGGALGASPDNPVPGINHAAAYPIGVLVYPDGGQFKLAFPSQMWCMMFYYWDAGIQAFVQYQTLPGQFDASMLKALGG